MDKGIGELKVRNGECRVTYSLHFFFLFSLCMLFFYKNVLFIQINKFKIKMVRETAKKKKKKQIGAQSSLNSWKVEEKVSIDTRNYSFHHSSVLKLCLKAL